MAGLRIALLDDNVYDVNAFTDGLRSSSHDFEIQSKQTTAEFTTLLQSFSPQVVILDVNLGPKKEDEGLKYCQQIRQQMPNLVIVMRSNADDASTIVRCMQFGADDFISKQTNGEELAFRISQAYALAGLKAGRGDAQGSGAGFSTEFAGKTMQGIAQRIPRMIDSAVNTFHVSGESGTGKEQVAELFHRHLGSGVPFVKINCAAIAPNLMESELFGYVKGAFTGAVQNKTGLLVAADGGWIFLDEVAMLNAATQAALLRVIENHEVLPVGATKPQKIRVRVISAANQSIAELVQQGKFRQDLWQRLSEKQIELPPLRERPDEIPALIEFFCRALRGGPYKISDSAMQILSSFSWKQGNIRELRSCLRAMTEFASGKTLTPLGIPDALWKEIPDRQAAETVEKLPPSLGEIRLTLSEDGEHNFDELCVQLFCQMLKIVTTDSGKVSLRNLSRITGLSRTAISSYMKRIVDLELMTADDLQKLVSYKST